MSLAASSLEVKEAFSVSGPVSVVESDITNKNLGFDETSYVTSSGVTLVEFTKKGIPCGDIVAKLQEINTKVSCFLLFLNANIVIR